MTIRQQGGVFGRHPSFSSVTADQIAISGSGSFGGSVSVNGNVVLASGSGVDFSATAGTGTSELFDDYEEGTWTPAWSRLTVGDFAYSAGGSDLGLYTKVGNTVYASFRVGGTFTESTASGTYCITGLPFTKDANDYPVISIRSTSSGAVTTGSGQSGGTKVLFFGTPVSGQNYLGALVYRV